MKEKGRAKWYQWIPFIIISLIFLPPIGIFLLWKYTNWNFFIKGILTFVSLAIFSGMISPSSDTNGKMGNSATKQRKEIVLPSPTPIFTDEYKNILAKTFCDERSKPHNSSINLNDFILMYEKSGEAVTLRSSNGSYPTMENCQKIIGICLKYWSKQDCESIAEQKIWLGMEKNQLILSWGLPNDMNNTVGNWGFHSQWVYGDFGPYVYLEGTSKNDSKVTSWQD